MPSTPLAILIAGILIALAIAAHLMVDRYQLVGSLTLEGQQAVWRINMRNGEVTPCVLLADPAPAGASPTDKHYVRCRGDRP